MSADLIKIPDWVPPLPTTAKDLEWAEILTVDLNLFDSPSGRQELVKTVSTALRRDGFFYVTNHGLSDEQVHRQFNFAQATFDNVSKEEKEQYRAKIAEMGSFRGYKLQQYWEIGNGVRDRIEHYNFFLNDLDPVESHPIILRPHLDEVRRFHKDSRELIIHCILTLIEGVLELPDGFLWEYLEKDGKLSNDPLRYMLYEPLPATDSQKTNGVYLAGHTDFGMLTVLFSQPVAGLQIRAPSGEWKWVQHRENALVINLGDQLSFLSGGVLKATIHRVVRPPPDQEYTRRVALFYFAQALPGFSLQPLFSQSARVAKEGRDVFANSDSGGAPTTDEWVKARVKSYGTAQLVKGEKWDTEVIGGIPVRHYK